MGKNQPANAGDEETWVRSLGWEDPLEESMAIHSSILAWRIPRTEEPGRLQSDTTEATSTHTMSQQYLIFVEVSRYTISILV